MGSYLRSSVESVPPKKCPFARGSRGSGSNVKRTTGGTKRNFERVTEISGDEIQEARRRQTTDRRGFNQIENLPHGRVNLKFIRGVAQNPTPTQSSPVACW